VSDSVPLASRNTEVFVLLQPILDRDRVRIGISISISTPAYLTDRMRRKG